MTPDVFIQRLAKDIKSYSFRFKTEKELQSQLEQLFTECSYSFDREFRISGKDVIDFLMGAYGVEVKVGGSIDKHLRQLKRYADHPRITAIILIGTRPYSMPETLSGKPCFCINVTTNRL